MPTKIWATSGLLGQIGIAVSGERQSIFERILIPLDGSRFSGQALRYAIKVAQRFGAELLLIQVVPPTPLTALIAPPDGMGSPVTTKIAVQEASRRDKSNIDHAQRYLRRKLRGVATKGIKGSHYVVTGTPDESITKFCQKEGVGLVVMTTHGKSGLKRAIMGSVADKIIRESGVPVLVIRPKRQHTGKRQG